MTGDNLKSPGRGISDTGLVSTTGRMLSHDVMSRSRSAYIHVPFCAHRCGYCNFTVIAGRDDLVGVYLEAIARELSWLDHPREVDTLYFGGGTPTHLSTDSLQRLLVTANIWFPLANGAEFTVEANPSDLNEEKLKLLVHHGVTRISLGAQSQDNAKLYQLERDHSSDQVTNAFYLARKYVDSVSVDLIFAAPDESLESWSADLDAMIRFGPDHLSTYGLTYEKGMFFWSRLQKGLLRCVEEELERSMYAMAIDRLTAAGFEHYEVSSFARPGRRCRHNEVYWSGGSYYAVGPSATRFVDGRRETNHRSTTSYVKLVLSGRSPVTEGEFLSPENLAREVLVFGLRRLAGIERATFFAQTGFSVEQLVADELSRLVAVGLLEDDGRYIRLSRQGLFVSDSIWPYFLRM